jgi:membrane-associated phospholipid phosphatase
MKKYLAIAASVLFHPMLMPLLGLFLIFNSGTHISFVPSDYRLMAYLIVLGTSCLLPLSLVPLMLQFKLIENLRMETRKERIIPVFTTGLFYILGFFLLRQLGLPVFIYQFVFGSLIALFTALAITLFWKISLHLVGIGGVTGAVVALSLIMGLGITPVLVALFWIAAITASARLYLGAHTPSQTLAGFALGFLIVMGMPLALSWF